MAYSIKLSVVFCFFCFIVNAQRCKIALNIEAHKDSLLISFKNLSQDSIYFYYNLYHNLYFKKGTHRFNLKLENEDEINELTFNNLDSLTKQHFNRIPFENLNEKESIDSEFFYLMIEEFKKQNKHQLLDSLVQSEIIWYIDLINASRGTILFLKPNEEYSFKIKFTRGNKYENSCIFFEEKKKKYLNKIHTYNSIKIGRKIRIPIYPPDLLFGYKRFDGELTSFR